MKNVCCYTPTPSNEIKWMSKKISSLSFSQRASFFKTLGDTTRLKILYVLTQFGQLSVCDIAKIINVSVSAVSHQLLKLKYANLIACKKSGRMMLYSLSDKKIPSYISFA